MGFLERVSLYFDHRVAGNPLWAWMGALGAAMAVILILVVVRRVLARRFLALAEETGRSLYKCISELLPTPPPRVFSNIWSHLSNGVFRFGLTLPGRTIDCVS